MPMIVILNKVKKFMIAVLPTAIMPLLLCSAVDPWTRLDDGLWLGEFNSPRKAAAGDSKIIVLRIDPDRYQFKLLCRSETGDRPMPLNEWAEKYGCVAAINAAMFQTDSVRSIGYMKTRSHINNSHIRKNHKCLFAFDPLKKNMPDAAIFDMECDNFDTITKQYQSLFQSIRMLSCRGKNVWKKQQKRNSIAALAVDKGGDIHFLYSRSPYTVHDFINIIRKLPLDIKRMMYLEGGSPACFYLSHPSRKIEQCGMAGLDISTVPLLPNVLGIVKR
ncbi:MAG: hypothetical protein GF401_01245 [Chitinivibrionales bacterium]|nr:hypothetical protein [Chitinivibrionales bacterium]